MQKNILHITNGDSLTNYLKDIGYTDDIITWREMLCEGPTVLQIDSEEFFSKRSHFLNNTYNIPLEDYNFKALLKPLKFLDKFDEIHLWFEYDLFCHINLVACLSLLYQKEIKAPVYLICSGYVEGETQLKGLSELTPDQLNTEYNNRIQLEESDIELALAIWRTYCGKDHRLFKPYITKTSNFKYLTNCLKAHVKRFPNTNSGLSTIEENILKIINKYQIKSKHHLMGYCLSHQGYYGFGDIQFNHIIKKLNIFYSENKNGIVLNDKGKNAIEASHNYINEFKDTIEFGGVNRMEFQFSPSENQLIKTN